MKLSYIKIFFVLFFLLNLPKQAFSQGKDLALEEVILRTSKAVSAPLSNKDLYGDWNNLHTLFSKYEFQNGNDSEYIKIKSKSFGTLTLSFRGARTMVMQAEISRHSPSAEFILSTSLKKLGAKLIRCSTEPSASEVEQYYLLRTNGFSPITLKYEYSSGSGGGAESLTFDRKLPIPEIGSEAVYGKWTDSCSG